MAARSGVGNRSDADAAIVPQFSGYRDEKTLELRIDTAYAPVISWYIQEEGDSDAHADSDGSREELERFRVVIPMSRIVSARPFEQAVFDDFFAAGEDSGGSASTMHSMDEADEASVEMPQLPSAQS